MRTDYGFNKLSVCEMLHCTFSELQERCKEPADYPLALKYIAEKDNRLKEAQEKAKAEAEARARLKKVGVKH
ncbi:hypothetical protein A3K80_00530 [Candidatus Bathyarchaeota archaeon RBG_13_38_9]|nr:MAG: hypothetical protein A3K80_00530 [Candidatus Bathyarchaeota archaeon RBG_13_38_9]